jgi:hypothetical protein
VLLPACLPARLPACLPHLPNRALTHPPPLSSPPSLALPPPCSLPPASDPLLQHNHNERRSTQTRLRTSCPWCSRASLLPCAAPSGRPQVTHALGGRRRLRQAGKRGLPAAGLLQREPLQASGRLTSSCPAKPRAVCRSWLTPNTHYACFSCPAPGVTRCLPAPAGRSSASTSKSSLAPPGVALPSLFDKLV